MVAQAAVLMGVGRFVAPDVRVSRAADRTGGARRPGPESFTVVDAGWPVTANVAVIRFRRCRAFPLPSSCLRPGS